MDIQEVLDLLDNIIMSDNITTDQWEELTKLRDVIEFKRITY